METWDGIDRYMILSSDTHAGAGVLGYRTYLERSWHQELDAWAGALDNPFAELGEHEHGRLNGDSDVRLERIDQQGVSGEVIFAIPANHPMEPYSHPRDEQRRSAGATLSMPIHHQGYRSLRANPRDVDGVDGVLGHRMGAGGAPADGAGPADRAMSGAVLFHVTPRPRP